jgi:hypothetical protein
MGPETKVGCAGEDQQQFNRPTVYCTHILRHLLRTIIIMCFSNDCLVNAEVLL